MTSPRLPPSARPIAAACFRQVRQRLAYMRQQEQALPPLRGFQREMAARTCANPATTSLLSVGT
jgi:hypothetical protein